MVPGGSRAGALPGGDPERGCGGLGLGSSRAAGAGAFPQGQSHSCASNSGRQHGKACIGHLRNTAWCQL